MNTETTYRGYEIKLVSTGNTSYWKIVGIFGGFLSLEDAKEKISWILKGQIK